MHSPHLTRATRPRRPFRRVLRFGGDVVLVSGALLLGDAAATLAWQEPVSSFLAGRDQAGLEDRLDKQLETAAAAPAPPAGHEANPRALRRRAAAYRRSLDVGDPVARITLPSLGRSYVVVHGTDTSTLRTGPGHYPDTPLPAEGGTVAIAGHRTTYLAPFRTIDRLRRGQPIVLTLPYGRFTYRVERTRIVPPNALWVKRPGGYDRLILSACHPLYSASKRIVVFARLDRSDAL